ncbi:class I poly(R)-hydroxyalkanoic acid synthase [Roseibium polysiphoniae]|uniref:Class I poly(R)-hydroxyalkanoic acid synthase n=1 Tax=Roseibium polysiphoniae TaxID=2571221 RepID=A0A944CCA5_9HYPH|nr:class I poly(R)-hydroxyalkanoic acid synthase [Roseibium polysiphoniae]MBS8259802.1 class I poly(R)-hydroxyalkanoic acid synthase [Roseibium polysiphoniae]
MSDDRQHPMLQYIINNPEAFANNLAKTLENAGKALAAYLEPREKGEVKQDGADELTNVIKTLAQVGEYWASDPQRAVEAQSRLMTGYIDLWNSSLKRMMGESSLPAAQAEPRDKRFADPDWNDNQFFDFIKQLYLITSKWAEDLVLDASGLDEHTRHKAEFYVTQISNALSPSNFLMTNPELLRLTLESNGENLVKGMQHLVEDIKEGHGAVKIRMTDTSKFALGKNLGLTPGKVVAENDVCQVLQYEPTTTEVLKRPLLIVPPWINKFYILDLTPEKSFIKWAVDQGHTVFVISWVNPDERQAQKSFEHYMKEGILNSLDVIKRATRQQEVNAIGYCVGGTLLSVTLAYLAARGDERIKTATFFTTQVDFTYAGDLKVFVDEEQIAMLEKKMAEHGYLDGSKMASAFNMLRSNDLIWSYVVNNYLKGKDPFPFDLLYWNSDSTRMPAANHSFYLRNCYLENNLAKGRMEMDGERLDLSKVQIPIYNLATREDHIAPPRSVFLGSGCFGGPVDYVLSGSGHIAGVVNPPSRNKYQFWTGGKPEGQLEDWLKNAEEHPGSWWPHWDAWIRSQDATLAKARKPGAYRMKILGDAPGSYVTMKA